MIQQYGRAWSELIFNTQKDSFKIYSFLFLVFFREVFLLQVLRQARGNAIRRALNVFVIGKADLNTHLGVCTDNGHSVLALFPLSPPSSALTNSQNAEYMASDRTS